MQTIKETIEWRIIAVLITFIITYLWTGKMLEATGLTIVLNLVKTVGYYLWRKIRQGQIRVYPPDYLLPGKIAKTVGSSVVLSSTKKATSSLWRKIKKRSE